MTIKNKNRLIWELPQSENPDAGIWFVLWLRVKLNEKGSEKQTKYADAQKLMIYTINIILFYHAVQQHSFSHNATHICYHAYWVKNLVTDFG